MKAKWVLQFLIFVPILIWAQQKTQEQTSIEYRWPAELKGTSTNVKALVVDNGTIYAGTDDHFVLISSDTGKTWVQKSSKDGLDASGGIIWSLLVTKSGHVLAGCESWVYESTDGGGSWFKKIDVDASLFGRAGTLFQDHERSIFIASYGIIRSTDDGNTWTQVADNVLCYPYVDQITETTSGVLIAGINSGSQNLGGILLSTDGGTTWNRVTNLQQNIRGIAACSSRTVLANTESEGILRSDDEGLSWKQVNGVPEKLGESVAMTSAGAFAGFTTGPNRSALYRSTDGGTNWGTVDIKGATVLSLAQFNDKTVLVGTSDGMWVVRFDLVTGIGETNSLPDGFELSQNYPNPFNPTTSIKYTVAGSKYVTLTVYDVLGKEVATLVNEEKFPGSYEVSFNASNLPSGVYFYRLDAGSFTQTKKMLLIK